MTPQEAAARLTGADWLRNSDLQRIFDVLDGRAGRTRAVGGIVRDTLLGRTRPDNDVDLATELLPDEVMRRAGAAGISAYPTGIEHGTVTLRLAEVVAEVTTLRQDIETDGRHAVVAFGTDWRRDAERRDFTLNALYADPDGSLFDPIGGLVDCLTGRVRFIGDPAQRITEDRLRVYRFFRFSASHGDQRFDDHGLRACRMAASELGRLSAERVGYEMTRMLALPKVALTLQVMVGAGVLLLGEQALERLARYEQQGVPTLTGRLALIIGDAGAESVQGEWRLSNSLVKAAEAVLAALRLLEQDALNEAAYRFHDALPEALQLAAAMQLWAPDRVAAVQAELADLHVPAFPLSGRDLTEVGWTPGKPMGDELRRLERAWIDSGFALGKAELRALAGKPNN